MADKTSIEIKIEAAAAANSVKDLRTSLKGLKDELNNVAAGSAEFKKISNAINETEGKLGDLNDSFNTLTGSGIERTNKSVGLLKEGFFSFDFDKIKLGFKGLGAAMSAIPIFLIIEGLKALWENFDKVTKFLKEVTSGFDDAAKSMSVANDQLLRYLGLNKQLSEQTTKSAEHELKLAELRGESIEKITELKIKQYKQELENARVNEIITDKYIANNKKILQGIIDAGLTDSDYYKKIREQQDKLIVSSQENANKRIDLSRKIQIASLEQIKQEKEEKEKADKEAHDKWLKIQEEKKKKQDEENKEASKRLEAQNEFIDFMLRKGLQSMIDNANAKLKYQQDIDKVLMEQEAEKNRKIKEQKETDLANENAYIQASLQEREDNTFAYKLQKLEEEKNAKLSNAKLTEEERIAIIKDSNKKETELKEEQREQNAQIAKQGLNAIQGLSDLYFQSQLKSAKGNAAKEKEIRKQQFNVNKAFGITNAVIDGVRGVQSALAMGPPAGYVFAAISAVMAGINIAKIASAKFDEGGSSSGATDVGSAVGSAASAPPPTVATPQNTVDTTKFGDGGKNLEMTPPKAQVVETEITSKQKIVTKMEGQAVF